MDVVAATVNFVQNKFSGEASGHDWAHIRRVYETSLRLLEQEDRPGTSRKVVELAALLHDLVDWKFNDGDDHAGPEAAEDWLTSQHEDPETIHHVCRIIRRISFKGAGVPTPMETEEGKIVQDADRLDAIGAIGIARAFAYGGFKKREMFNPDILPEMHETASRYKVSQSTTINHFFEKLLLLKDRMNTRSGKKEAEKRQQMMIKFLQQFFTECHEESSSQARELRKFEM
ncbi:HD domain-containing protein [Sporolactobacillus vineae]|uniref:HD domain-containing protein n=1 Tax=Sporolactobacillus vineae TaxID=444463 RepID=UPI0002888073|nr:HD domain-containing protein [Sporolactobacillus vineae]